MKHTTFNFGSGLGARLVSLGLATGLALAASRAQTAWSADVWVGAANGNWSAGANWRSGAAPATSGADVRFADLASGIVTATVNAAWSTNGSVNKLRFEAPSVWAATAGTGTYTLVGSGLSGFTVGAGGIANLNAQARQISLPYALSGDQTWLLSGGLTLTEAVGGSAAIAETGGGTLILGGANGALSAATALVVSASTLSVTNATGALNANRLPDSMPLTLQQATLSWTGVRNSTENVGQLRIGRGTGTLTPLSAAGSVGTAVMQFSGISRELGGLLVVNAQAGNANMRITGLSNTNGIIGGWATYYNGGNLSWATNSGTDFASLGSFTTTDEGTWDTTANVYVGGVNNLRRLSAARAVNTLEVFSSTLLTNRPVLDANGRQLKIDTGGFLLFGGSNYQFPLLRGGEAGSALTAGAGSAVNGTNQLSLFDCRTLQNDANAVLALPITDNGSTPVAVVYRTGAGNGALNLARSFTIACTNVTSSPSVTFGYGNDILIKAGDGVSGPGVPNNTTVLSVDNPTQFTMTASATNSGVQTLTFTVPAADNSFSGGLYGYGAGLTLGKIVISKDADLGAVPSSFMPVNVFLDGGMKLSAASSLTLSANRGITIGSGGGMFEVVSGGTLAIPGVIAGPGLLNCDSSSSGTYVLQGNNTFTGGLMIGPRSSIIVKLGNAGALNAAQPNVVTFPARGFGASPSLQLNGYSVAVGGLQAVTSAVTYAVNNSGGSASPATLTITNVEDYIFTGTIQNGTGGALSLVKAGPGVQVLGGANTYSGGTTVNQGTLLVNNTSLTASGTGTGVVTVAGGVLGGTGFVTRVAINGGTLNPGNPDAVGTLTVSNLTCASGSMTVDLAGDANADKVVATGTAGLGGSLVVQTLGAYKPASGQQWTILTATGTVSGTFGTVTPGYKAQVVGKTVVLQRSVTGTAVLFR